MHSFPPQLLELPTCQWTTTTFSRSLAQSLSHSLADLVGESKHNRDFRFCRYSSDCTLTGPVYIFCRCVYNGNYLVTKHVDMHFDISCFKNISLAATVEHKLYQLFLDAYGLEHMSIILLCLCCNCYYTKSALYVLFETPTRGIFKSTNGYFLARYRMEVCM